MSARGRELSLICLPVMSFTAAAAPPILPIATETAAARAMVVVRLVRASFTGRSPGPGMGAGGTRAGESYERPHESRRSEVAPEPVGIEFSDTSAPRSAGPPRNPCYTGYVANLTLVIGDETLRLARIRALELGTSVNAIVREHLDRLVSGDDRSRAAVRRIVGRAEGVSAGAERTGRQWTRDELYEERLGQWSR